MVVEQLRVAALFHLCLHPARKHMCSCELGTEHSDAEWDKWYDEKEASWLK